MRATSLDRSNSTNTLLAANEVFVGTAIEVATLTSLTISVVADHPSSNRGLNIQQGHDGQNWIFSDSLTVGNDPVSVSVSCKAAYLRVTYTNGAVAQGSFSLQTLCHRAKQYDAVAAPATAEDIAAEEGDSLLVAQETNRSQYSYDLLTQLLAETRLTNTYLSLIVGDKLTIEESE